MTVRWNILTTKLTVPKKKKGRVHTRYNVYVRRLTCVDFSFTYTHDVNLSTLGLDGAKRLTTKNVNFPRQEVVFQPSAGTRIGENRPNSSGLQVVLYPINYMDTRQTFYPYGGKNICSSPVFTVYTNGSCRCTCTHNSRVFPKKDKLSYV